jgi:nucleoid-associated protein YgaU
VWLRALAAGAVLLVLLLGVPALLLALGSALPVDLDVLAPRGWMDPDEGGFLLLLLLAIGWVAWGAIAATVVVELLAAARRAPAPRLPGLGVAQRLAAALVASLVLVPTHGWATTATAGEGTLVDLVTAMAAQVPADDRAPLPVLDRGDASSADEPDAEPDEVALSTIGVERHDTLWGLAERHLGDGGRFGEIVDLNLGVPQSDGRSLGPDGRLHPGWRLRLPADAHGPDSAGADHRVRPGETLWEIAQEHLGEGSRYPEVFAANRGERQPDGGRLVDPDLIRPGWLLEVPGTGDAGSDGSTPADPPADAAPADPTGADATPGAAGGRVLAPLDRVVVDEAADEAADERADEAAHERADEAADERADEAAHERADEGAHERADERADAALLPAGGALTALLLAGLAGELARRRRQFQRHRRPGERMPSPSPDQHTVEERLRDAVTEGAASTALLDRALDRLGREAARSGRPLPRVRRVLSGPEGVRIELAEPSDAPAVAPFVVDGTGAWVLDETLLDLADHLGEPGAAQGEDDPWPAFPGLVALGTVGAGALLVDLTTVGTLRVVGPPEASADVLRGLAVELALGVPSRAAARTACLSDPAVVGVGEPGAIGLVDAVGAAQVLGCAARSDGTEADPVELVLADCELPGPGGAPLVAPSGGRVALITSAAAPGAGATLRISAPGAAVLEPDGIALQPQSLPPADVADVLGLLTGADVPEDPDTHPDLDPGPDPDAGPDPDPDPDAGPDPDPDPDPARELETLAAAPPRATAPPRAPVPPRLLLLGALRVEGAAGPVESTRIGRLAETIAFVHLNPDSRPSALQSALWPGSRSSAQTCRQMITRARTWLGRADGAQPYLEQLSETGGVLRLRPEVTSDWDDFQRLAEAGLADPTDTAQLSAALRLVRGRPFGPVAARELPWTDLHVNTMIELIVDVAHELALRHEVAGNLSAARDAALRGLRTECESEVLQGIVARLGRRV